MRVVDDAGDAGVDATECRSEIADIDIVRSVKRAEPLMGIGVVVSNGDGVGIESPKLTLPGVPVRVRESRDQNHVRRVNVSPRSFDFRPDRQDFLPFDQYVALGEVADLRVHTDDRPALEQDTVPGVFLGAPKLLERVVGLRICRDSCQRRKR